MPNIEPAWVDPDARKPTAEEHFFGRRPPLVPAGARELAIEAHACVVILVERWSDQAAARPRR